MPTINPYAPPETTVGRPDQRVYIARLEFWRVFLVAVALTVVVTVPILYVASLYELIAWHLLIPAFMIAFSAQALLIRFQRITISADILRCSDFWGRYHTIETNSINKISPVGFGIFRFLQLHNSTTKSPLWLPLFIARIDKFWEFICTHVEPGSEIYQAAKKRVSCQPTMHEETR